MTSAASASTSGMRAAAVAPTQPDKRRGFQLDAFAGEDLGLAIERQVIIVLRDGDMREQAGAGPPAGDRVIGCRRCHDRVAGPARQLLAHMPDHLKAAGHVIEGLGDLFADPAQGAAAMRAGEAAGCSTSSRGRCSGNGRRAGFCLPSRPLPPPPARRQPAARLDRPPGPRSPTRAARPRAPASPTNARTRPAGSAPAGSFSFAISVCAASASRAIVGDDRASARRCRRAG